MKIYFMLLFQMMFNCFARVTGPLMSLSASGSVADTITFASWKGRDYVREWFKPSNPNTPKQINIRTALTLVIILWQTQTPAQKTVWNDFAVSFRMSGFNQFVGRGLKAYMDQMGTDNTPGSVSVADEPPAETWNWTP